MPSELRARNRITDRSILSTGRPAAAEATPDYSAIQESRETVESNRAPPLAPKGDISYVGASEPTACSGARGFRSRRPLSPLTVLNYCRISVKCKSCNGSRGTVYGVMEAANTENIERSIESMIERIKQYVSGYRLRAKPLIEDLPNDNHKKKVTLFVEVEGAGDFLPKYAGNLDIMTSAAVKVGEEIGRHLLAGTWEKKRAEATL
jgi:hypothetical protein